MNPASTTSAGCDCSISCFRAVLNESVSANSRLDTVAVGISACCAYCRPAASSRLAMTALNWMLPALPSALISACRLLPRPEIRTTIDSIGRASLVDDAEVIDDHFRGALCGFDRANHPGFLAAVFQ